MTPATPLPGRSPGRGALHAAVRTDLGTLRLDVDIRVDEGEVVAVVGPNGAGKTTLLRIISGLLRPDTGTVALGERCLEDIAGGTHVAAEQRRLGVVFQDYLLFPHLSARENVAFGPRAAGVPTGIARARADEWLERLGLGDVTRARPDTLSGGQAQRVALARALATDPDALLLDEPLAALDAASRQDVRRHLKTHLEAFPGPVLLVTHEPIEAATLADRLVVLEDGRVTQSGGIGEVTRRPRTDWVARLVGANLYRGVASGTTIRLDSGEELVSAQPADGAVFAAVPPQAVALFPRAPEGTPRNAWPGRVDGIEVLGGRVRVHVRAPVPIVAEITPAAVADLDLVEGREVWAAVKATEVAVYPR